MLGAPDVPGTPTWTDGAELSTTPAEAAASPASPARPRAEVLRRADGIELIGEFEGSGFKEPPLLARRADGQVVQLTELLYEVAEAADGRRDAEVAAIVERALRAVGDRGQRPLHSRAQAEAARRAGARGRLHPGARRSASR